MDEENFKTLIQYWKDSTNLIVEGFCIKQDFQFDKNGWVGMEIGGVI